jgi:DNA-binding beta-propeller fold protein YncE
MTLRSMHEVQFSPNCISTPQKNKKRKQPMKRITLAGLLATSATCLAATTPSGYTVLQRYALGGAGKWDYLTLDGAAHRLYIARDDRVMVMDTQTGKLAGEVPGALRAHRVVVLPRGHAYVSNGHGDSVTPFDAATLKAAPAIALSGRDPDAMLYDTASGKLWTFNGHSNNASIIDPSSQKEIGTLALPGRPEFAVSDERGHLYVNLEDKAQIAEIDAHARKVTATWTLPSCEGPTGLAIDVQHKRLFSACANQHLVVLDADTGHRMAVLPIGKDPDAAGYDPLTGMVFSSNADGSLTIIHQDDPDHYSVAANLATAKGARTLALDAQTHRVYLAAPDVGKEHAFGVLVVGTH